jgi:hypothetical protein
MVTGLIGSAVLLQCRVDLGGIDILNACYAGAFGGIALDGPALLTFRFFPLLVSFIISSICLAIMRGVQWIHLKWTENWMDRSHLHSYGSRGDDLEINAELQSKTQPNPPGPSRY